MRKILVLGQSVSVIKAIEQIRASDQESEIIIIGFSDGLPMLMERFPEWVSRQIAAEHVGYKNEKFYQNLRVEFITGRKISRINFARKIVFFEDKTKLEADMIIIAGADKDCFPGIKGAGRDGVFSLKTADQVLRLQSMMGRIDTAILESMSLRGVMFAKALLSQNKEVILCTPSGGLMPGMLDNDVADMVIALLQQEGIRVIRNGSVKEILGDEDVKAVRLNMDKVIACETVIFPDALPDMRLYNKGELALKDRVCVDQTLKTNCDGVFATDEMTDDGAQLVQFFDYESLYSNHAARLAAGLRDNPDPGQLVVRSVSIHIAGRELLFLGEMCACGMDVMTLYDENGMINARIFLKNDVVQGAFLIDNASIGNRVGLLIHNRQGIDWQGDEFFSSHGWQKTSLSPSGESLALEAGSEFFGQKSLSCDLPESGTVQA